jgi:ArsR family transcriptional regulator
MDILPRHRLMVAASDRNLDTAIAKFKALADPIRMQVIELLRQQEMCVCDLCDQLGVAQSKLSFHLKTLREAGLLNSRQQGRWIYYSLNLREFLELEEYLAEIRRFSPILPAKVCK